VSIFVNPLQFNQSADFDSYPRPLDDDLGTCRSAGVDAVFAPTAATMYPPGFQTRVVPGELAERLEGPLRPGHFTGVTTVVTKLFGAVEPDTALFGEKDFQQLAIIRRMTVDLDLGIDIVGVPIVREHDGLARSSRNVRLTPDDRGAAVVLSTALRAGHAMYLAGERDAGDIRAGVVAAIAGEPRASVEYVEVIDATTLEPVDRVDAPSVIAVAAWFGDVRLIDNQLLDDRADGVGSPEVGVDVVEDSRPHDREHHPVEDRVGDHGRSQPAGEVGRHAERHPDA
jgi:pantoate--beta-alanine ligase